MSVLAAESPPVSAAPSMCGRLRRVLLVEPGICGWGPDAGWRGLGYFRPPDGLAAAREHRELRRILTGFGVEVLDAGPSADAAGLTPDATYCHDASFPTARGMILMRMGKRARRAEPAFHRALCEEAGIPVVGTIEPPGLAEGGDLVWLDSFTILAGEGYRTNSEGIRQLQALVAEDGVEVVSAPLPHGNGPGACLHLMSLLSVLDRTTLLADPHYLAVSTLRLLGDRGFTRIPIVEEERDTMAANVLALGDRALLALEANPRTNERLRDAGFRVLTYVGDEISANGSGGPTCLTRPILRDPA